LTGNMRTLSEFFGPHPPQGSRILTPPRAVIARLNQTSLLLETPQFLVKRNYKIN
jgi:hypothetical protein